METITPTDARRNLYTLIKKVVSDSQPIEITSSTNKGESVVIVSKEDWNSVQETLYLEQTGVLERIRHFENEKTEGLDEVDWDTM